MRRAILVFVRAWAGISILVTGALIYFAAYRNFAQSTRKHTAEAAVAIASALEFSGPEFSGLAYLESLPRERLNLRLTLIAGDGRVLFDTGARAEDMENHRDRPEVRAALEGGFGESLRFSGTLGKETYYYAVRLGDRAGAPAGTGLAGSVLRAAHTTDSVFAGMLALVPWSAAMAAVVFILTAWAASGITRKIVAPVNRIDLDNPENNDVYEEFTPLLSRLKKQNEAIAAQIGEIQKRRLEFEAVTDHMREGLLVLDQDARILFCNRSARRLLEIRDRPVESQSVFTVRRDEPFREAVEKALAGGAAEASFSTGRRRVRLFANPVADGRGVQGLVLLILDVTEREDRERLRREFSANVSHELKTPLMSISGRAEIMAQGLVKAGDMPRFAGEIYREAQRLLSLINDIMTLSSLDEGEGLLKEKVELSAFTGKILERIRGAAESRDISLFLEAEPAGISGIPRVLDQMIFNLLDNAVKYNREGGEIRVSVRASPGETVLSVADTGPGIGPDEQERVFERFYRVDKSRSGAVPGTGLGLAIVKHGAALHEAALELRSDGKTGSEFILRFPG